MSSHLWELKLQRPTTSQGRRALALFVVSLVFLLANVVAANVGTRTWIRATGVSMLVVAILAAIVAAWAVVKRGERSIFELVPCLWAISLLAFSFLG